MSKAKFHSPVLMQAPVSICLCTSKRQFRKSLKKEQARMITDEPWLSGPGLAKLWYFEDSKAAIVCIDLKNTKDLNVAFGLLVHEAMHIWREIKIILGEDEPSEEFEAYSMQMLSLHLFGLASKEIKKIKRKGKRND